MVAVYGPALLWLEIRISLATVVLTWFLYLWGTLDHLLKLLLEQELSKTVFLPVKIRSCRLFLSYCRDQTPDDSSCSTNDDWLGTSTPSTATSTTLPSSWWPWLTHHVYFYYEWWWYHSLRGMVVMQDVSIQPPLLDTRWEIPAIVTVSQITTRFYFWSSFLIFLVSLGGYVYVEGVDVQGMKIHVEGYEDPSTNELVLNVNLIGVNPLDKRNQLLTDEENQDHGPQDEEEEKTGSIYEKCQVGMGLGFGVGLGVGIGGSCLHPLSPLLSPSVGIQKNKGWLNGDADKCSDNDHSQSQYEEQDQSSGKEGDGSRGMLQKGESRRGGMFGQWVTDLLQSKRGDMKGTDINTGESGFWEHIITGGILGGIARKGMNRGDEEEEEEGESSCGGGIAGGLTAGERKDSGDVSTHGGGTGVTNTSLSGFLLPPLPTPEQIKQQISLASHHLKIHEWENYLRDTTARSDLTGMFDWARSDLTGKFDWARSDLTGLSKWESYMRDTTATLRHTFEKQMLVWKQAHQSFTHEVEERGFLSAAQQAFEDALTTARHNLEEAVVRQVLEAHANMGGPEPIPTKDDITILVKTQISFLTIEVKLHRALPLPLRPLETHPLKIDRLILTTRSTQSNGSVKSDRSQSKGPVKLNQPFSSLSSSTTTSTITSTNITTTASTTTASSTVMVVAVPITRHRSSSHPIAATTVVHKPLGITYPTHTHSVHTHPSSHIHPSSHTHAVNGLILDLVPAINPGVGMHSASDARSSPIPSSGPGAKLLSPLLNPSSMARPSPCSDAVSSSSASPDSGADFGYLHIPTHSTRTRARNSERARDGIERTRASSERARARGRGSGRSLKGTWRSVNTPVDRQGSGLGLGKGAENRQRPRMGDKLEMQQENMNDDNDDDNDDDEEEEEEEGEEEDEDVCPSDSNDDSDSEGHADAVDDMDLPFLLPSPLPSPSPSLPPVPLLPSVPLCSSSTTTDLCFASVFIAILPRYHPTASIITNNNNYNNTDSTTTVSTARQMPNFPTIPLCIHNIDNDHHDDDHDDSRSGGSSDDDDDDDDDDDGDDDDDDDSGCPLVLLTDKAGALRGTPSSNHGITSTGDVNTSTNISLPLPPVSLPPAPLPRVVSPIVGRMSSYDNISSVFGLPSVLLSYRFERCLVEQIVRQNAQKIITDVFRINNSHKKTADNTVTTATTIAPATAPSLAATTTTTATSTTTTTIPPPDNLLSYLSI